MKRLIVLPLVGLAALSCVITTIAAQDAKKDNKPTTPATNPTTLPTFAPPKETKEQSGGLKEPLLQEPTPRFGEDAKPAFMIMCDSQPNRMIVLDANGRWMSAVRSADIRCDLNSPVMIVCTMYEGVIKPSQPQVKTWQLAQIKTVPLNEFMTMIDALQQDAEAIKKQFATKE